MAGIRSIFRATYPRHLPGRRVSIRAARYFLTGSDIGRGGRMGVRMRRSALPGHAVLWLGSRTAAGSGSEHPAGAVTDETKGALPGRHRHGDGRWRPAACSRRSATSAANIACAGCRRHATRSRPSSPASRPSSSRCRSCSSARTAPCPFDDEGRRRSRRRVTVTGESPLVDISSTQVGGNVDRRQMEELPLQGRNWMELAMQVQGHHRQRRRTTRRACATGSSS